MRVLFERTLAVLILAAALNIMHNVLRGGGDNNRNSIRLRIPANASPTKDPERERMEEKDGIGGGGENSHRTEGAVAGGEAMTLSTAASGSKGRIHPFNSTTALGVGGRQPTLRDVDDGEYSPSSSPKLESKLFPRPLDMIRRGIPLGGVYDYSEERARFQKMHNGTSPCSCSNPEAGWTPPAAVSSTAASPPCGCKRMIRRNHKVREVTGPRCGVPPYPN